MREWQFDSLAQLQLQSQTTLKEMRNFTVYVDGLGEAFVSMSRRRVLKAEEQTAGSLH